MEYLGFIFGIFGILAYARVEKLEKRLKDLNLLEESYSGEE